MKPTKQQYDQAVTAGGDARRAARPREKCPLYGHGEYGEIMREAWYSGWEREDADRKAAA